MCDARTFMLGSISTELRTSISTELRTSVSTELRTSPTESCTELLQLDGRIEFNYVYINSSTQNGDNNRRNSSST